MRTLCLLLLLAGCPKDSNEAKLMPRLPPPATATIPADLRIAVTLFGEQAPAIDHKLLSSRPPDYKDQHHQAWRIASLIRIQDATAPITVVGERGVTLTLPQPAHLGEPEPALFLTRRGEVTAALTLPSDPFPAFHGTGRQLGRAGDPLPRLAGRVIEIRVGESSGRPRSVSSAGSLIARIGAEEHVWDQEQLAKIARIDDGGDFPAWSLRDVVTTFVGPKARVTAVIDAAGARADVDVAAWADTTRTPVLRSNRKGQLKIFWLDAAKAPIAGMDVHDVRVLEIVR